MLIRTPTSMRFPSTSPRPVRAGFTILELAVVLVLTGIVIALAVPRIDVARYKADTVVTTVRSVLQQAQRASLVNQHDVIISFDIAGNRIRTAWDKNNDHQVTSDERVTWRMLSDGNRFGAPPIGIHDSTVLAPVLGTGLKTVNEMPSVTFHRDGSLSSDLEIYLATTANPVRWRAVTAVQATGRTDWYRRATNGDHWIAGVL